MKCRHCAAELDHIFVDLATAPPSNAYVTKEALASSEKYYPLRVLVCDQCWLVQTEDYADATEFFSADYAYFSSISTSWLDHSKSYVKKMTGQLGLGAGSMVTEVAANDGYLLQYVKAAGIPCYGIEPTASTAAAARDKGIDIVEEFFGEDCARQLVDAGKSADLIVANNVLAHVPDINDFVRGFAALLKHDGVATFEFPHLQQLMEHTQFDTIYHEHFSYLSLTAVATIFAANGLQIFNVEKLPTHGGSLRVFAQKSDEGARVVTENLAAFLAEEFAFGLADAETYSGFQPRCERVKNDLLSFLLQARKNGKSVAAYGAAAKGNTLLNFAGVRPDLVQYVVDRNPAKQEKFMPGSRIPIVSEERLQNAKPDYVLILPWNISAEIMAQLSYVTEYGGQFVRAVPELDISKGLANDD